MTELRTERLLLRRWRDEDLEPMARIHADPAVMRWIGEGKPYDRAASDSAVALWRRHWDDFGYGLFAAELLATGETIGFVGLMQPFFMPALMPSVEAGWRLATAAQGRGLATEAAMACVEHGFGTLGLDRLISIIRPENEASVRVARKLGMLVDRTMDHPVHGWPLDIYAIDAGAWRAKRDD